ncbi:armadillo-like helical domain-containing protein 3 [Antedon mediterranea]|uniref:armadillo-like helical domain-containing protein 3 n=1 Tax=Antedon mediterranea TaxID=105859 RepID=UPI003AF50F3F
MMPDTKDGLLRTSTGSKGALKEKIVQIYDAFFQGKDPSKGVPNFWDEMFLLKANVQYIESEFGKMSPEQVVALKENINTIFYHCVETLKEDYLLRIVNALQTLCALVRGVHKKRLGDHSFDIINILIGFDSAEAQMQTLIMHLNGFLTGEYSVSLKNLTLRLLLVLVTVTDNVSQNTILEYLMINSVFEAILKILADPTSRQHHGFDAVLLLTILVNYRKHESANPYILKLSILDNELALTGLGCVVSSALADFNRQFGAKGEDAVSGGGWFSAITNMVGSIFVADTDGIQAIGKDTNLSILLTLYEAVHLNRNFITVLSHNHAESDSRLEMPTSASSPAVPGLHPVDTLLVNETPTNILATFFSYCSIIMQDTKDNERLNHARLCLIILNCIAEDQYANSFLHDANLTFKVHLHKVRMRHRKPLAERDMPSRPLACALLDLMVEFVMSHMMKNFPEQLYLKCLSIIHRIMCYQKKCRVRLHYCWKDLWTALISLLKYLLSSEQMLMPQFDVFEVAIQVVNIFNLFITYGDTFLPNPTSYDDLYYEIIRMHQIFDQLYSMALRHSTNNGDYRDTANKLTSILINIRAIINHFTPKIDSWSAANNLTTLTEEQVLDVVRGNYDTLTLKLQDSLDQYERYSEKPKEIAFFTQMVRTVVCDSRKNLSITNLEQQRLLKEFSTIT